MTEQTADRSLAAPPRRPLVAAIAVLAIALTALLGIGYVQPPAPLAADAPATEFSAGRAFAHVERIAGSAGAERPGRAHVTGSAANDEVREYLVDTMEGLGLSTTVQDAVGRHIDDGWQVLGRVRNVISVLPGTASTGRVFLVAHYDSVQSGPGASDDGSGVAALLETARILSQSRPRNDIVFLITDGEEAGLLGAEAFASLHPLAARGGVVVNVEARGTGGPAIMFETATGNAALVDVFASGAPHKVATSFAVEVYRILPNDTDFSVFLDSGRFTGLNSAYIDGSAAYHTPLDIPSKMDRGSLQAHGDNLLGVARELGSADLARLTRPGAYDATYFPVPGFLVRYPGWLVWPFAVLALLAVATLAWLARRRAVASWPRMAAGLGLGVVPLALAPIAAQLLWLALVALRPGYANMIDPWRPQWYRAAAVALTAAILLAWYALARRRVGPASLAIGALGWLVLLGLVLAAATPGGSYLATLPALAGALAGIVALSVDQPAVRVGVLLAGAAVAVLILAPTVVLFFPALGLAMGGAGAFFGVLCGLALLPVLEWLFPPSAARRRPLSAVPPAVAALCAVAFATAGFVVDRFDPAHPVPSQVMYALDTDNGEAFWVSGEAEPGAWTSQYVAAPADLSDRFPVLADGLASGPAQAASLPAPQLSVVSDATAGTNRVLTVRVTPQRTVRMLYFGVQSGPEVRSATVNGREVALEDGRLEFEFHAVPATGVTVSLVLSGPGPATLRVMDGSDGLASLPGFKPRPPDVGIAGTHTSDLALVARTYTF